MAFRINRVYTRTGDDGTTGLVGGERVSKSATRLQACGDVDELNSALGVVKERLSGPVRSLGPLVEFLQQELFDLGSELATPFSAQYDGMWRTSEEHVARLEKLCDRYGTGLAELSSFILPGGSETAALLHLARTVCRRAERRIVELIEEEGKARLNPSLLHYLNRLSDLLFVLARWSLRAEGREAPLWTKGEKRTLPED